MQKLKLPDFKNPPVIETVFGLQFDGLNFSIPHFGLYYSKIRSNYPKFEVYPPLDQIIERFDLKSSLPAIDIGIGAPAPEARCWFIEKDDNRLIQLQKDRFLQNWRKIRSDDAYPRYENLKPIFEKEWLYFSEFLKEEKISEPKVNQCEITYINHLEIGKGWHSLGDIAKIVKFWSDASDFLPSPERVSINLKYEIPEKIGRLHINLQPGIRTADNIEIFQLELTARGKPSSSKIEDIMRWFDLGHEWIVKGFTDFTTTTMHNLWGKKT